MKKIKLCLRHQYLFCCLFAVGILCGGLIFHSGNGNAEEAGTFSAVEAEKELCDPEFKEEEKKTETEKLPYVEGEVLVVYKNNPKGEMGFSKVKSSRQTTKELMESVAKQENVSYVQPNYIYRLASEDTYFPYQYYQDNNGQFCGKPGVEIASDQIKVDSKKEVVVAVVDSGVDYTHEDLEKRMWRNPFRGNLKGVYGVDTGSGDTDPMDEISHGTHVAGIIAAETDNELGIGGVAGNAPVKIMAVKVFDATGMATTESIIEGYTYIYEASKLGVNVRVVNNSFSANVRDNMTSKMIELLGKQDILTVISAGNEGEDLDCGETYPAVTESRYRISVAASDQKGNLASYSNYGSQSIDLAAPGSNILSTIATAYADFEPSLYTDEQKGLKEDADPKNVYCRMYQDFSSASGSWMITSVQGSRVSATARRSFGEFFGNGDMYSLEWKIKGAQKQDYHMLMFPYVSEGGEAPIHESAKVMIKNTTGHGYGDTSLCIYHVFLHKNGTIDYSRRIQKLGSIPAVDKDECWKTLTVSAETEAKEGDLCAFIYQLEVSENLDCSIFLDDVAISKRDLPKEAMLAYGFYNGTSMSAPAVSGAVARLASQKQEKSALELKKELLSCVTTTYDLEGKVKTGGTLCLRAPLRKPFIDQVYYDLGGNLILEGGGYAKDDTRVKIDGKKVKAEYISDSMLRIRSAEQYSGQQIRIRLENDYGEETQRKQYVIYKARLKPAYTLQTEYYVGGSDLVSDGKNLYVFTGDGILARYGSKGVKEGVGLKDAGNFEKNEEYRMSYYDLVPASRIVYAGGKFYVVLNAHTAFTDDYFLASYDIGKKKWKKESNLPYEYRTAEIFEYSLATYRGGICLLGGMSQKTGLLDDAVCYLPKERKWIDLKELPVKMAHAATAEVNGKLYVFGGYLKENPQLYIYDGKEWETKKIQLDLLIRSKKKAIACMSGDMELFRYYPVSLCAKGDQVLFSGNALDGYGDLFYYDTKKEKMKKSRYSIRGNSLREQMIQSAGVGDNAYILCSEYIEDARQIAYTGCILKEKIYQITE